MTEAAAEGDGEVKAEGEGGEGEGAGGEGEGAGGEGEGAGGEGEGEGDAAPTTEEGAPVEGSEQQEQEGAGTPKSPVPQVCCN